VASEGLCQGLVALVTGAGSGIGRAVSCLIAKEQAEAIALVDVNEAGARHTEALLAPDWGGKALVLQADVARSTEVDDMINHVVDEFGRLDCAVNNAGVRGDRVEIADCSDDEWQTVMDTNLNGIFYCLRAEIRAMKAGAGGSIVNISSSVFSKPVPGLAPYCSSKFGVVGLTRVAAGESTPHNIRVNAVLPGATVTPLQQGYRIQNPALAPRTEHMPMKRFGEPGEVAEAVVWLLSSRASYVHGETLMVDGGTSAFTLPAGQE
jgi:NAD(P)-dependent dehydrogenase (short-subunit alcohol dehydrogenase family)